jgi:hypothetical protein
MTRVKRQIALWLLFLTAAIVSAHDRSFPAGDLTRKVRLSDHHHAGTLVSLRPRDSSVTAKGALQ